MGAPKNFSEGGFRIGGLDVSPVGEVAPCGGEETGLTKYQNGARKNGWGT